MLPAGGIHAIQGTFSSFIKLFLKKIELDVFDFLLNLRSCRAGQLF